MNYAELVQSVVVLTGRDELVPQIQYAIAKATLKLHSADLWNRDLVEKIVGVPSTFAPRYMIDIRSEFPRFRKIQYLNGYDVTSKTVTCELQQRSPISIGDNYGRIVNQVYYLSGDMITIRSVIALTNVLAGFWALPPVDNANYKSWIADVAPYAIIDEASAEIFGSVGDDEEAARRRKMFEPNVALIRVSDIEAAGR